MAEKSSMKFECKKCGSNRLGYQKGVLCVSPVAIQSDNHVKYGQFKMGEDEDICFENSFLCMDCNSLVSHCSGRMETEKQLLDYLSMDHDVRDKERAEYEEFLRTHEGAGDEDGMYYTDLDDLLFIEPPKD